jgi:hypothetical protein
VGGAYYNQVVAKTAEGDDQFLGQASGQKVLVGMTTKHGQPFDDQEDAAGIRANRKPRGRGHGELRYVNALG